MRDDRDRVMAAADGLRDEAVAFAAELVRIPTVNPPGEHYEDCARAIGAALQRARFEVEYHTAHDLPEHTLQYPRVNVVGIRRGEGRGPLVHLNGHFDVVPAGDGWSFDPFGGSV